MKPPAPFYCNAPLHWKTAFHCLWLWLWNTNLPHSLNSLWTVLRLQKLDKSSGWGGSGEKGLLVAKNVLLGACFWFVLFWSGPVVFFFVFAKSTQGVNQTKGDNIVAGMLHEVTWLTNLYCCFHGLGQFVPRTLFMSGCLCDICFHFWTLLIHTALIFRMSEPDCFQMAFLVQF